MPRAIIRACFCLGILVAGFAAASEACAASPRPVRAGEVRVDDAVVLDTIYIEGRIYKPQVFYILGRAGLAYQGLERRHDFVAKILTSARKTPF